MLHNVADNIARASGVYCNATAGSLLQVVQLSGIFNDSKTFVDMPMKTDPELITDAFQVLESPISNADLLDFVNAHFDCVGSDLVAEPPADWQTSPALLNRIPGTNPYRAWAADLNELWLILGRRLNASVAAHPQRHSYLPMPYPFIVPGGRFRESYYWDSYFIIQVRLLASVSFITTLSRPNVNDTHTF
jgi:alpha,alpha-trehalase